MINFGHCRDGRFATAARNALLDRDARGQTLDEIDIGSFELFDELPRVRRHAVEKSSLSFREQNVEGKSRFAGAAQTGDHDHLVARNFDIDVFQVVLTRAVDRNCAVVTVCSKTWSRLGGTRQFNAVILSVSEEPL